ncbi:MAG: phosphorelay protein [Colwelliaceae bacterium]|nr:phosphorelay protein [Colwelliaceae bacterium]
MVIKLSVDGATTVAEIQEFDQALIQGYLENLGVSVVERMLDLYIQQSAIYLQEIEQAIATESQDDWQERCHKMKGAAASVGLMNIHAFMADIEKSTLPWAEKDQLIEQVSELNVEAIERFKVWLAKVS